MDVSRFVCSIQGHVEASGVLRIAFRGGRGAGEKPTANRRIQRSSKSPRAKFVLGRLERNPLWPLNELAFDGTDLSYLQMLQTLYHPLDICIFVFIVNPDAVVPRTVSTRRFLSVEWGNTPFEHKRILSALFPEIFRCFSHLKLHRTHFCHEHRRGVYVQYHIIYHIFVHFVEKAILSYVD